MENPVNLRIFNTAKFRQGHRSEDWENRDAPPDQAYRFSNRYSSEIPENVRVIEFDLNDCLAQDSYLENFESSPKVELQLEYHDGQRWRMPKGEGNQIEFDPNDFESGVSSESFSVTRNGNIIRLELARPLQDTKNKYRLQVTLTQTFPSEVTVVE